MNGVRVLKFRHDKKILVWIRKMQFLKRLRSGSTPNNTRWLNPTFPKVNPKSNDVSNTRSIRPYNSFLKQQKLRNTSNKGKSFLKRLFKRNPTRRSVNPVNPVSRSSSLPSSLPTNNNLLKMMENAPKSSKRTINGGKRKTKKRHFN